MQASAEVAAPVAVIAVRAVRSELARRPDLGRHPHGSGTFELAEGAGDAPAVDARAQKCSGIVPEGADLELHGGALGNKRGI